MIKPGSFEDKNRSYEQRKQTVQGISILFDSYSWKYKLLGILLSVAILFFVLQGVIYSIYVEYTMPSLVNQTTNVLYYKDVENISFEQLKSEKGDAVFAEYSKNYFVTGVEKTNLWIKMNAGDVMATDVNGNSNAIIVTYPPGGMLNAYFPIKDTNGTYRKVTDYDENKFSVKNPQNPYRMVMVPLDIDSSMPVYMNITTKYPSFAIYSSGYDDMMSFQGAVMSFYLTGIGVVGSIVLLSIFLAYFYRSKYLTAHAAYNICIMIILAYYSGVFSYFLNILEVKLPVMMAITLGFYVLFVKFYFENRIKLHRKNLIDNYLNSVVVAFFIFAVILFFNSSRALIVLEMIVISLAIIIGLLIIFNLNKEQPFSRFFLMGVAFLSLGGLILGGCILGFLEESYWIKISYTLFVLEPVLFTIGVVYTFREFDNVNKELYYASVTDSLTGIYNRMYLDTITDENLSLANYGDQGNSLILYDIDLFKHVNDKYGHGIGDEVIKEIVELAGSELRDGDIHFRWGGEEFLIVLPKTNIGEAAILAEKIRKKIEKNVFDVAGKVTISLGVVQMAPDEVFIEAFENVDDALYKAKNSGRNRSYVLYGSFYKDSMMHLPLLDSVFISTNNDLIDKEHMEIISIVDDIRQGREFSTRDFLEKVAIHEHNEERMLIFAQNDDAIKSTKFNHSMILENVENAVERYENHMMENERELSLNILEVFMNHIIVEDIRLFEKHITMK